MLEYVFKKKKKGNLGIIIDKVQRVEPPDATPRQLLTQLVPSKKKLETHVPGSARRERAREGWRWSWVWLGYNMLGGVCVC